MAAADRLDLDDRTVVTAGVVAAVTAFLPWYETPGGEVALTGWGLGAVAVLAVLLAGYAAVRVVYTRGREPKPEVPVTPQAETFVAALLALLLLAFRLVVTPEIGGVPAERSIGILIATGAVLAQVVCAGRKLRRTGVRAR